jgi:hypothetical protein
MTFDSDKPEVLSSTIKGIEFESPLKTLWKHLAAPMSALLPRFTEPPPEVDLHLIVHDMCDGEYADTKKNCTTKAKLPSRLWMIDTVLKRNVCPLGHKTQRTGDFLAALYAFYKKYWVSIPQLIWSQMFKCWEDKVDKGLLGPKRPALPFPFLVTKLVLSKGLSLSDTTFSV